MKSKLKLCAGCDRMKIIWKNVEGKRYCQQCSIGVAKLDVRAKPTRAVPSRSTRIKQVSDKRQKLLVAYKTLQEVYKKTHKMCEAKLPGCTLVGQDVHHMAGKASDELYIDTTQWLFVCRHCHRIIEENPVMAKELGLSKSRLNK